MPILPPDRSHIRTEHRDPRSMELDALDTRAFIELMADDHGAVVNAVERARPALAAFIDALVPRMRQGGRLIYLGAGTSGRLGVLDASECPPTFQADPNQVIGIIAGGDASLRKSSEGKEDDPEGASAALRELSLNENDTVLGIAAGGTTPYVLGALRIAKSITGGAGGATTGLLTCAWSHTPPSPRSSSDSIPTNHPKEPFDVSTIRHFDVFIDHLIHLETGPELLTGSTRLKAGSATKLALNIISTAAFVQLGKVYSNLMVDLRATNAKLNDRAIRILIELCSELSREQAASLLDRAQGHLKAAIIMQRLDIDLDQAHRLLNQHCGNLRAILR